MDSAQPSAGDCIWLEPGLRRVLAPNPSPMTHWGTNSYIIGEGAVALIDPGPDLPAHRDALLAALRPGERISHILVTHAHLDHSPLARPLAALTGAPVLAFGPAAAGRSAVMAGLDLGGGEGVDAGFAPDWALPDGAVLTADGLVAGSGPGADRPAVAAGRAVAAGGPVTKGGRVAVGGPVRDGASGATDGPLAGGGPAVAHAMVTASGPVTERGPSAQEWPAAERGPYAAGVPVAECEPFAAGGPVAGRAVVEGEALAAGGPVAEGPGWRLEVIHTPGHFGNHICLAWGDRCFTGDHVMGWASSLVSPPDGDMAAYMASLARLAARDWAVLYPGHGAPVTDAAARLTFLAAHRRQREAAILAALAGGPLNLVTLTARVYAGTTPALLPAASRNTLAHLVDLAGRHAITAAPALTPDALFTRLG